MMLFNAIYKRPRLRRLIWRLGRKLYMEARGDLINDMQRNGEAYIQQCVAKNVN